MFRRSALPAYGVLLFLSGSALSFTACGGNPSADEVDRSMREFQLAAALREEGNIPGALEHLRRSLELDPKNARAHLLLGYIHLERGAENEAEEPIRTAIQLLVKEEGQGSLVAEARNLLGVVLINQRRYAEAEKVLREAASDVLNTAPYFAWGNLGWAYHQERKYDRAVEAYKEAVRIQPRFCVGHFRLGQTLVAKDDLEQAEDALTQALEADTRCAEHYQDAWRMRGEARARLGKREDAVADFERCVELAPRSEAGKACKRYLEAHP